MLLARGQSDVPPHASGLGALHVGADDGERHVLEALERGGGHAPRGAGEVEAGADQQRRVAVVADDGLAVERPAAVQLEGLALVREGVQAAEGPVSGGASRRGGCGVLGLGVERDHDGLGGRGRAGEGDDDLAACVGVSGGLVGKGGRVLHGLAAELAAVHPDGHAVCGDGPVQLVQHAERVACGRDGAHHAQGALADDAAGALAPSDHLQHPDPATGLRQRWQRDGLHGALEGAAVERAVLHNSGHQPLELHVRAKLGARLPVDGGRVELEERDLEAVHALDLQVYDGGLVNREELARLHKVELAGVAQALSSAFAEHAGPLVGRVPGQELGRRAQRCRVLRVHVLCEPLEPIFVVGGGHLLDRAVEQGVECLPVELGQQQREACSNGLTVAPHQLVPQARDVVSLAHRIRRGAPAPAERQVEERDGVVLGGEDLAGAVAGEAAALAVNPHPQVGVDGREGVHKALHRVKVCVHRARVGVVEHDAFGGAVTRQNCLDPLVVVVDTLHLAALAQSQQLCERELGVVRAGLAGHERSLAPNHGQHALDQAAGNRGLVKRHVAVLWERHKDGFDEFHAVCCERQPHLQHCLAQGKLVGHGAVQKPANLLDLERGSRPLEP
mmetsp:Transcript_2677/g.10662  ORF Transcript_2677/g.10662 Transcript_2677/m.10662 type:complete len:618 (+) Transcript_2677:5153-7006(+)